MGFHSINVANPSVQSLAAKVEGQVAFSIVTPISPIIFKIRHLDGSLSLTGDVPGGKPDWLKENRSI